MKIQQFLKFAFPVVLLYSVASLQAFEIKQENRQIHVSTQTFKAIIHDSAIIHLCDHTGKILIADERLAENSGTAGLGNMKGKARLLSMFHRKNGDENIVPPHPLTRVSLYRRPNDQSTLTVKSSGSEGIITWNGLSDGDQFYPQDSIQLILRETLEGALGIQGNGSSQEYGVFGLQIPIENIRKECNFVLPVFGGMFYRGQSDKRGLMTYMMDQMYYDAPIMTLECDNHAVGLWSQDETFRQTFAFFQRGERSNAFALELMNSMPFEQYDNIHSPELLLNIFPESGWIGAARSYHNWYQKQFAREIAIRDNNSLAENIYVMLNTRGGPLQQNLDFFDWKRLSADFGGKLAFCFWHLRKAGFDRELPDFTLSTDAIDAVKFVQSHNGKAIGYFNPLCANYNSKLFQQDHLKDIVLTRINTIDNYNTGTAGSISELQGGSVDGGNAKDRFAGIENGKILYLDPLSSKWRKYILDIGDEFRKQSGLDFLYIDCLGVVNDPGNGTVEGKSGAEGLSALASELITRYRMPFMTEYGPAPMAFAAKWPLVCTSRHDTIKPFFSHRLHNQRPMSAFLFGYRPYNYQVTLTKTEAHYHMTEAVADSTSGLGFVRTDRCEMFSGFKDHLFIRAKVFADHCLKPHYPEKKYPKFISAMYQDHQGRIFCYYDDGFLQAMLDPDGKALYGRINGKNSFVNADVGLSQWPLQDGETSFGLDPEKYYALFPKNLPLRSSSVRLTQGSHPVRLEYYYETDHYAYLEVAAVDGTQSADFIFKTDHKYQSCNMNGEWQTIQNQTFKISAQLPLRCIFSDGKTTPANRFRYLSDTSGQEDEKAQELGEPKMVYDERKFYLSKPAQSVILDGLYEVESKNDMLDFHTQNIQFVSGISNASIVSVLINGITVKSYDAAPARNAYAKYGNGLKWYLFDYDLHHWRIPLAKYAGQKILVTVKIDSKGYEFDDLQIVSIPEIIQDEAQQKIDEKTAKYVPAHAYKRFKPDEK